MNFVYNLNGNRHIREYFSLDVYTQEEALYDSDNAHFAPTKGFEDAKYYIKNAHGTFVDLAAVFPSYGTSSEDAAELYLLKRQYMPESLI